MQLDLLSEFGLYRDILEKRNPIFLTGDAVKCSSYKFDNVFSILLVAVIYVPFYCSQPDSKQPQNHFKLAAYQNTCNISHALQFAIEKLFS